MPPLFQSEVLGPKQLKFWAATALEGKAALNSPQRVADLSVPELLPEASAMLRECLAARVTELVFLDSSCSRAVSIQSGALNQQ